MSKFKYWSHCWRWDPIISALWTFTLSAWHTSPTFYDKSWTDVATPLTCRGRCDLQLPAHLHHCIMGSGFFFLTVCNRTLQLEKSEIKHKATQWLMQQKQSDYLWWIYLQHIDVHNLLYLHTVKCWMLLNTTACLKWSQALLTMLTVQIALSKQP